MYHAAFAQLGRNTRPHKNWFDENDEEIRKVLDEKYEILGTHQQESNSPSYKAA